LDAARVFGDKYSAFDTTHELESTPTGADCANLLRCKQAQGPPKHSTPATRMVASEIGPVLTNTKIFVWTWQITLQTRLAHRLPDPEFPDAPGRLDARGGAMRPAESARITLQLGPFAYPCWIHGRQACRRTGMGAAAGTDFDAL